LPRPLTKKIKNFDEICDNATRKKVSEHQTFYSRQNPALVFLFLVTFYVRFLQMLCLPIQETATRQLIANSHANFITGKLNFSHRWTAESRKGLLGLFFAGDLFRSKFCSYLFFKYAKCDS
jgi:hypothetical protein